MRSFLSFVSLFVFLLSFSAFAAPKSVRWTGAQDKNAEIGHVLEVIREKTNVTLSPADFVMLENRRMANYQFVHLAQSAAGVPIKGQVLRIWTSLRTGDLVQLEATVDEISKWANLDSVKSSALKNASSAIETARSLVKKHGDDPNIRKVETFDQWDDDVLVRTVQITGRRGKHSISIALNNGRVLSQSYHEFPQSQGGSEATEFALPAMIYPIYEEVEQQDSKQTLDRVQGWLKYIKASVHSVKEDPYAVLRKNRYLESKLDPLLGLTVAGRKQGFWTPPFVKFQATEILNKLPTVANSFENGVVLEGRFATINLHPEAAKKFSGKLKFTPAVSAQFRPDWKPTPENPNEWEMIPAGTVLGQPLKSYDEAWNRPAQRLPDHDPVTYINDGFDELQVYWAINQMFDSLRSMGFTDPELSTRPFNAFLYDPDISYRDNAYYTDDTINFTTYSSKAPNMARDNTTIWHELGHGVMDRLMGDHIRLADTGGLSEGMADFVAQLVLHDLTGGKSFPGYEKMRILNQTGFHLTNEVHDDGEAYGGAMQDMLVAAENRWGRLGHRKMTDLTLDAMRLARNHPGLTAGDWFNHMLFADELGNAPLRRPGELKELVLGALAGRNFSLDMVEPAKFTILNGADELTSTGPGSRENPIRLQLKSTESKSYALKVSLKSTNDYQFKYPVTIKVGLRGGPLQGAVHWQGEENQPQIYTLNSEKDVVNVELTASGKCDEVNQPDGTCKDFAYLQVWNNGETKKPQAKKRFYLRIKTVN